MGKLTSEPFIESCCDGGATCNATSALPCGCDTGAPWVCQEHREKNMNRGMTPALAETLVQCLDRPTNPKQEFIVKDSGDRLTFTSGSMRDTTTGKLNWSRVAAGPMLRRWAQHLTTAEAKYPDVAPGVANWTLIETDEEYARYKESAFRHFMMWYYDIQDEDHASACYFNINGCEHIREKNKGTK